MASKIDYIRQSGYINIKDFRDNKISIVGCGANGGFIGMCLAKIGMTKFVLYDFDKIESHNIPNQLFEEASVGKLKVDETKDVMERMNSDVEIETHLKYNKTLLKTQIVISCVDKMSVRKEIFNACKKDDTVQLFIDTRMSMLEGQVYIIDMNCQEDVDYYEQTLFSDKEAVQTRCTDRSILFTVLGISSIVCNQLIKALNGEEIKNYIVLDFIVPQLIV